MRLGDGMVNRRKMQKGVRLYKGNVDRAIQSPGQLGGDTAETRLEIGISIAERARRLIQHGKAAAAASASLLLFRSASNKRRRSIAWPA